MILRKITFVLLMLLCVFCTIYTLFLVAYSPSECMKRWLLHYARTVDVQYHELSRNGTEVDTGRLHYTLWRRQADDRVSVTAISPGKRTLFLWLNGGALLLSDRKMSYGFLNLLHDSLGDICDVATIDYPVRFKNTARDAVVSCDEHVVHLKTSYGYDALIIGGSSMGTFLAASFLRKEFDPVASREMDLPKNPTHPKILGFVSICGLFFPDFKNDAILSRAFGWYIMRGTPGEKYYSSEQFDESLRSLVIGSEFDFLKEQTLRFIEKNPSTEKLIFHDDPALVHGFQTIPHLPATIETVAAIREFVVGTVGVNDSDNNRKNLS